MPEGWYMDAKYEGKCAECGREIGKGDRIGWLPRQKAVLCAACASEYLGEDEEEK